MMYCPNEEVLYRLFCIGKEAVRIGTFKGERYEWIALVGWPDFLRECVMFRLTWNDVRDAIDEANRLSHAKLGLTQEGYVERIKRMMVFPPKTA